MKIIETMKHGQHLEGCVPYAIADEKIWIIDRPNNISISDNGKEIDNATPEQIKEYAQKLNEHYELYSGWDDKHILLESPLRKHGCTECPFRDVCDAMQDEANETYIHALAEKLYNALWLNSDHIDNDMEHDYLTENTGRDGKSYLYYLDENRAGAIDAQGNIITDEQTLDELFA